jgi:hypothetical protein
MQKILAPNEKIIIEQLGMKRRNASGEDIVLVTNEVMPDVFDAVLATLNSGDAMKMLELKKKAQARYKRLGAQGARELVAALAIWCAGNGV